MSPFQHSIYWSWRHAQSQTALCVRVQSAMEILHTPSTRLRTHTNPIHWQGLTQITETNMVLAMYAAISAMACLSYSLWDPDHGWKACQCCAIVSSGPSLLNFPCSLLYVCHCYVNTHTLMLVVHHKAKCFLTSFLQSDCGCFSASMQSVCGVPQLACDVNKLYLYSFSRCYIGPLCCPSTFGVVNSNNDWLIDLYTNFCLACFHHFDLVVSPISLLNLFSIKLSEDCDDVFLFLFLPMGHTHAFVWCIFGFMCEHQNSSLFKSPYIYLYVYLSLQFMLFDLQTYVLQQLNLSRWSVCIFNSRFIVYKFSSCMQSTCLIYICKMTYSVFL